jgi:hypothetical protein
MKTYKLVNGTSYDARTPDEVIAILEKARQERIRLHVSLGYTDGERVGLDWLEEFDSHGYIGRSTGSIKVPLMIANSRSTGGGALLDHCVVRIRQSAGGRVFYQHRDYHYGSLAIRPKADAVRLPDGRLLTVDVLRDGEFHAAFESMGQARRWLRKLGVEVR